MNGWMDAYHVYMHACMYVRVQGHKSSFVNEQSSLQYFLVSEYSTQLIKQNLTESGSHFKYTDQVILTQKLETWSHYTVKEKKSWVRTSFAIIFLS